MPTNKNDGRGNDAPGAITPQSSVSGNARSDVPGGESSGGKWSDQEGPNPGRSPRK